MAAGTCESCGATDEVLEPVRRVYLTPAAWDTEARVDVAADVEHWCIVCRTHYPYEPTRPVGS